MSENKDNLWRIAVSLVMLFTVSPLWGLQNTSTQPADKKPNNRPPTVTPDDALPTAKNPFRYYQLEGTNAFLPTTTASVPAGIKVLAIMVLQGQKPLAVLQVPGMVNILFVQAGDIVGVENQDTSLTKRSPASNENHLSAGNIVYLKIENVTSQQVELSPKENPDGKQILR